MGYKQRWQIIRNISSGGQGSVSEVFDQTRFNIEGNLLPALKNSLHGLTSAQQEYVSHFDQFRNTLMQLNDLEDPYNHGALKLLHPPEQSRDPNLAEQRIQAEIMAMQSVSHPNLLKLLDSDPNGKWFVSQYYPKGTLYNNRIFVGKPLQALRAFRSLVEGVTHLHKVSKVHRDIKPQNIFLDAQDNLVLGDFGLIFTNYEEHTRISDTLENVGSRDWMPFWATSIRIEDILPNFDVFSLGKVLWMMLSTTPILQLWYYRKDQFNLEKMFPNDPAMKLINNLLDKCIVEEPENCIDDASKLLQEIDTTIASIESGIEAFDSKTDRKCKVCGTGIYKNIANRKQDAILNFGLNPLGDRSFKIYTCSYCGNVQLFYFPKDKNPKAWNE